MCCCTWWATGPFRRRSSEGWTFESLRHNQRLAVEMTLMKRIAIAKSGFATWSIGNGPNVGALGRKRSVSAPVNPHGSMGPARTSARSAGTARVLAHSRDLGCPVTGRSLLSRMLAPADRYRSREQLLSRKIDLRRKVAGIAPRVVTASRGAVRPGFWATRYGVSYTVGLPPRSVTISLTPARDRCRISRR